jgi:hypothetical protein
LLRCGIVVCSDDGEASFMARKGTFDAPCRLLRLRHHEQMSVVNDLQLRIYARLLHEGVSDREAPRNCQGFVKRCKNPLFADHVGNVVSIHV